MKEWWASFSKALWKKTLNGEKYENQEEIPSFTPFSLNLIRIVFAVGRMMKEKKYWGDLLRSVLSIKFGVSN